MVLRLKRQKVMCPDVFSTYSKGFGMFKANTKVQYKGTGRPYLKGLVGTVISSTQSGSASHVEFTRADSPFVQYTEYVGNRYLEEVTSGPISEAVRDLEGKLQTKKEEISKAQENLEALRKDEDALHRAIDALRVL